MARSAEAVHDRKSLEPYVDQWSYRQLDDLIALQLGPVRHTMAAPEPGTLAAAAAGGTAERSLTVHLTEFVYGGNADPSAPGGIAAVYRDL